ncbi:MAG TPA: sigma-E factor negative regulatory protein [Dyella sp.]|uniref:sigma-E factor negative regulatory protein n=1 Tax=Dyella sp. TaxID=1869338 RepID=UPI002BCA3FBC|nr:sigma-E factor negative regulatory protein [Dyella sp.]HTV84109.1 sigma-E factor negative regulatory protein [Dyella sp.]
MTEANMETLSAAMDGELSKEELRFLLRRLDHDAALLQAWTRYHVVGDGLRGQVPAMASAGFATRVMQMIESEQSVAATVPRRRDWLRLSVGGAIAASVAVAALMVSQPTAPDAERPASLTAKVASRAVPSSATQAAAQTDRSTMLAAVPPSLSLYPAYGLSQRASVTLGNPSDNPLFQGYSTDSQPQFMNGYRSYHTLNSHDGSYLLLIDTPQASAAAQQQAPAYQGAAAH